MFVSVTIDHGFSRLKPINGGSEKKRGMRKGRASLSFSIQERSQRRRCKGETGERETHSRAYQTSRPEAPAHTGWKRNVQRRRNGSSHE